MFWSTSRLIAIYSIAKHIVLTTISLILYEKVSFLYQTGLSLDKTSENFIIGHFIIGKRLLKCVWSLASGLHSSFNYYI